MATPGGLSLLRFDSADTPLMAVARQAAHAYGYTAELSIDRQLAQLLRLRVSQINACTYCLRLHDRVARELGIADAVLSTLTAWWETDLHPPPARAALAYAEALTRVADATAESPFQRSHDALAEHFDERQIVDIAAVVINMNIWTRLKLAEGATPT